MQIGNGAFWLGDCLELMRYIPDGSVDMILCDLPYGTTACKWDSVIPFEPLWREYWRVAKPNAAVVLTASQPFTNKLISSSDEFRYNWYWIKNRKTGNMNAKKQPLRCVEEVCIFAKGQTIYNPQVGGKTKHGGTRTPKTKTETLNSGYQYDDYVRPKFETPNHVLYFDTERGLHPTQKPVALFEYLIKTYTNPGELVLDNCAGSGTTAVAAERAGRRWLCIEKEPAYYYGAVGRVWNEAVAA